MSKHSAARKCSHLETRQATHKLNVISCWWVPVRMLCREQDHLDGKLAQGCIHFPNIIPSPAWSPSQFTGILVISDFFTTCCLTKALSLYFFDMKMPTFCPRHFGNLRQVTWLIVLLCSCPALSLQSGKEESLKTYSLRSVEVDPCNFWDPPKAHEPFLSTVRRVMEVALKELFYWWPSGPTTGSLDRTPLCQGASWYIISKETKDHSRASCVLTPLEKDLNLTYGLWAYKEEHLDRKGC